MFDRRIDPERSNRGTPQPDGIRWFVIYTTWTDVKGYPSDTTYTNQYCTARHTTFHRTRNEWIPANQFVTLYDPSRTSKPAIGDKVRAHFNPINQHWEVWNQPTTAYVDYALSQLEGFSAGGLAAGNTTGYAGASHWSGDESAAGIEYQEAELTPSVNGIWKVLQDGYYHIAINGRIKTDLVGSVTTLSNTVAYTTGAASAGTPHTHQVTIPDFQGYVQAIEPGIACTLLNKPNGGAIGNQDNGTGGLFTWGMKFSRHTQESSVNWSMSSEWNINASANDKLALRFIFEPATHWKFSFGTFGALRMRITRLGDRQEWTAF